MISNTPVLPAKYRSMIELVNTEYLDDGLTYVYVKFLSKIPPSERGTLLLDLEDELCKNDKSVRVWHIPLGDKNSLRNLRGITVY